MSHVTKLEELIANYQDSLVEAINDARHTKEEKFGLQMAAAAFRTELRKLDIANV